MSAASTPQPTPRGEGENGTGAPAAPLVAQEATPAVTPFPSKTGAGRVGSLRRRRLALTGAVLLVAFGVWYFAIRTPEPKDDLGRFQGEWRLAVPAVDRDRNPVARAKPVTIRVTGDRWAYVTDGKEKRYLLTLRPEASPKEIDLTMLGPDDRPTAFVLRGIYTIDRDRAKVIAAPAPEPRPTDPDAGDGPPGWLLERER